MSYKATQIHLCEQSLRRAKERLAANEEKIDKARTGRMPEWKRDAEIEFLKKVEETILEEIADTEAKLEQAKGLIEVNQLSLF